MLRIQGGLVLITFVACSDPAGSDTTATTEHGDSSSSSTLATSRGSAATTVGDSGGIEPPGECLLWAQDCPNDSDKCMPWSLEEDRIPDETRCCPVVAVPGQAGDPCLIEEYDGSCRDDCDKGAMCVLDRTDTREGYCHRFCDPNGNTCETNETCKSFFELIETAPEVPLCMLRCDPLVQDCPAPNWSCVPDSPTSTGQSGFICTPPPPRARRGLFDACALANDCNSGLVCVPAERVPNCTFLFCCTPFCSLSEPDPCPSLNPALQCVDWMSPDPRWHDVGACVIPN